MRANPRAADPVDSEVAGNIRAIRTALGVTQETLAERIGVTFQQVQKYETGKNRITIGRLVAISDALGVNVMELLPVNPAAETKADAPSPISLLAADRDRLAARLSQIRQLAS